MKTSLLPCVFLAAALTGCAEPPLADAAHNSRHSLDWAGTYRGVLPCADCEGIQSTVTLHDDLTYETADAYLGKPAQPFRSSGAFRWSEDGTAVTLDDDTPTRYRVEEHRLVRLDREGRRITGPLASHYILTKLPEPSAPALTDTYWKLTELRGRPVAAGSPEPHILLQAQDSRVIGTGGCNRFSGQVALEAPGRIRFSSVAATMMACLYGMDTERELLSVLSMADSYTLQGDRLTLNRARMAPLARFKAAYGR